MFPQLEIIAHLYCINKLWPVKDNCCFLFSMSVLLINCCVENDFLDNVTHQ